MIVATFDEGPGAGLGHRRRVECLERELAAAGLGCDVRALGDGRVEADVVLVDSYRVRADDPMRVRASIVIAIDDIDRDLAVDLVVDPRPGASARSHARARRALAGASYALVDARLRALPAPRPRETVETVLVATGATDVQGLGAAVASELARALPDTTVRLVVGAWGRGSDDPLVEMISAPESLGPQLVAADLVVTASGVTMLESCCLGRPTVAFSIADNQSAPLAGAAAAGAVLAADRATAAGLAARLAHDHDARVRLSASARALIDGRGARRVASAVESLLRQHSHAS